MLFNIKNDLNWIKHENIQNLTYINRDTLAIGCGNTISFINLVEHGKEMYMNNYNHTGKSIACVTGHPKLNMFAYTDLGLISSIYVMTFPEFREIITLSSKAHCGYLSIQFSETEHLIALTGIPTYSIEIWNWRSGKLLTTYDTQMITNNQYLLVSVSLPLTVTQIDYENGNLQFYDVYISIDTANLIKRQIKMPDTSNCNPVHVCYAHDGTIFLINRCATVWHIQPILNKSSEIIRWSDEVESDFFDTHFEVYKSGLLITGPGCLLKYYKKVEMNWCEIWRIKLEDRLILLRSYTQDATICITNNGQLLRLIDENDEQEFQIVRKYDRFFKFLLIVNPIGKFLLTLNKQDELQLFDVKSGVRVSSLTLKNVVCMQMHELLPLCAVGDAHGVVHLISIYNPTKLNLIVKLHLCSTSVKLIRFTSSLNIVIIVNVLNGDYFIIKGKLGSNMTITTHIVLEKLSLDFVVNENASTSKISIGILAINNYEISNTNELIWIEDAENTFKDTKKSINLPNSYTSIAYLNVDESPNDLLAIRYDINEIDILEINLIYNTINVEIKKSLKIPHILEGFNFFNNKNCMITWSTDGIVSIWDKTDGLQNIGFFSVNSRHTNGTKLAICDPFRQYVVTLGYSGNLICIQLEDSIYDEMKLSQLRQSIINKTVRELFEKETIGFTPDVIGMSWLDTKTVHEFEINRLLYKTNKEVIYFKFQMLKDKLKLLIDQNEIVPEDEQLAIQCFNLDTDNTDIIVESARKMRRNEECLIRSQCIQQNQIAEKIIKHTWDLMDVKGTKLRGIFTDLNVENYPLMLKTEDETILVNTILLLRSNELMVGTGDVFLPWIPRSQEKLKELLMQAPGYESVTEVIEDSDKTSSEGSVSSSRSSGSSVDKEKNRQDKYKFAISGTVSHLFIHPLRMRYNQLEVVSYQQMIAEMTMGQHDTFALRQYFNKNFKSMIDSKKYEMNLVKQRHDRLRYIKDELNVLEKLKESDIVHDCDSIVDPVYTIDEIPENLIKVEDWEVPVQPYISPSQQILLDKQAAEKERHRLEMLADDFRERALMQMMDGVLEIRWEDEIKKSPDKPLCMINGKDPKDFDKDDLKEIQEYETKMISLFTDREKYRNMLETEEKRIFELLHKQILNFNLKVSETLLLKMKIGSAICQEDLKLRRFAYFNFERIQYTQKETSLIKEINEIKLEIENYTKIFNNLEEMFTNCKTKYEELSTKDRLLEKQFKATFSEYATPAVVDQAFRIFKRRPKWKMREWQTSAILLDMARRINNNDLSINGPPLPDECFAYLQLIDQVEKLTNAPNLMDQSIWFVLCKMRRVKIEIEFKVRSCCAQVAEAEATLNAFAKEIANKKGKLAQCDKKLEEIKKQKVASLMNRTLVIVMKRGMIEIPLSGRMSDFNDTVLLHVSDVNDINQIIRKAGVKKLKAMENAAVYRRKIIYKEWEHKVLKMKIEDMNEFNRVIDKSEITKEVQLWLKRKQEGRTDDFSEEALERKMKALIASFVTGLHEIESKINHTENLFVSKVKENKMLDKKIYNINIDVTEMNLERNTEYEEKLLDKRNERMAMLRERSRLVRQVQMQHAKILELTTVLELERLKTYPTLNLSSNFQYQKQNH